VKPVSDGSKPPAAAKLAPAPKKDEKTAAKGELKSEKPALTAAAVVVASIPKTEPPKPQKDASKAPAAQPKAAAGQSNEQRKVVIEPKPEEGSKWLNTDENEVLTQHRVMRIVEPKPAEEKPRLPEAEGWTTVTAKRECFEGWLSVLF